MHPRILARLVCVLATIASTRTSVAEPSSNCSARVSRESVVRCALEASLSVRAERSALRATEGRREAASVVLPSNPFVAVTGGKGLSPPVGESWFVWSASLGQEFEIGGQRGRRRYVADAERSAQDRRVAGREQEVAANALDAYFEVLASDEARRLAGRLKAIADALRTFGAARASVGLAPAVDVLVAGAAAVQLDEIRLEAERRWTSAMIEIVTMLGMDPSLARPDVSGELVALAVIEVPEPTLVNYALRNRPEIQIASAEADAFHGRAGVFRSLRVPNPTLSVFARNDWPQERAVGLGLSFPIPLPAPLGRTFAGEIAEAEALGERAQIEAERLRRAVRQEVLLAMASVDAARNRLALFRDDDVRRAEASLGAIGDELRAQRIGVRDALLTEQTLLGYLLAGVEAKRRLCQASVALARVAGVLLEGHR